MSEGFDLVVNKILEGKPIDLSVLPESQRKNFDISAQELFSRGFYLEAAKVFAMTKNEGKLLEVAQHCLKERKLEVAYYAFNALRNKEGLNRTGEAFLQVPDVSGALSCFEAAQNEMMSSFIRINF